jgi:hypothetical protein
MNGGREKLSWAGRADSVRRECRVERYGFAVWVLQLYLLRTAGQHRNNKAQGVGVFKCGYGVLAADGPRGAGYQSASAKRDGPGGAISRCHHTDSQRNLSQLNHNDPGILRGTIARSNGEGALSVFISGQEAAV